MCGDQETKSSWPSSRSGQVNCCVCEMLDLKIIIALGGGLLIVTFVLMAVVICLYYKVANALKCSKAYLALTIDNNEATVTMTTDSTNGSYPSIRCCEECNLNANSNPLPP
ncbi:protein FAM24A-like [Leopardus geoffroyi]|uniref:protein FAM24A-like n=1 Tax=Leopardus geoffroyi TaxID=46844 RepID=UPI001E260585|nr:protein FAM24A-like [Leopardus geoffroyi]